MKKDKERTSFAALAAIAVVAAVIELILLDFRPGSAPVDRTVASAPATTSESIQVRMPPRFMGSSLAVPLDVAVEPEVEGLLQANAASPTDSQLSPQDAEPEATRKMSRDLVEALDRGEPGPYRVIVQVGSDKSADELNKLEAWGREHGFEPQSNSLSFIGATVFEADVEGVRELAALGSVSRISLDAPVRSSGELLFNSIGVDQVWSGEATGSGLDGQGIGVAILDSGVQYNHGDFEWSTSLKRSQRNKLKDHMEETALELEQLSGRMVSDHGRVLAVDFVEFVPPEADGDSKDDYGHGTHVAGIIAGNSANTQRGRGGDSVSGIAPGATLLSLRVVDGEGVGTTLAVLEAIAFVLEHRELLDIRVMNLSLGHPVYESCLDDPLTLACAAAVEAGIAVVCSGGNTGWFQGAPAYGTVQSPGHAPWVITVGATNQHETAARSDDTIARFSSRGPTAVDGLMKPDLVAPGLDIVSCKSQSSYLPKEYEFLNVKVGQSSSYMRLSGTSMAAPSVTGTLALMFEANPSLSPNAAKAILLYTAQKMIDPDILSQGSGYLNAEGAVRLANAIRQDSDEYEEGEYWLRAKSIEKSEGMLKPRTTIAGERVYWGSAFLWGQGALWYSGINSGSGQAIWGQGVDWDEFLRWADGDPWLDPLIAYKSSIFAQGALWYSGINSRTGRRTWTNGTVMSSSLLYRKPAVFATWSGSFVNPDSIRAGEDGDSVLVFGEDVEAVGYEFGSEGDWFYPTQLELE